MAESFAQNLRYFCANFFFANFCAIFAHFSLAHFFAQNRKFDAKCNFSGKLSTIDILSLELNN